MMQRFDAEIIVIGSGPGGATSAALLAENGRDVLMLEEGPEWNLDSCRPFSLNEMRQKYRHGGLTAAIGKPTIAYAEGRCLGGGSEVNSALYHRAPADILDDWRVRYRVEGLTESALEGWYRETERDLSVSASPQAISAASLRLQHGAHELGWRAIEVPRCMKFSPDGAARKQAMSETMLPRARAAGARVECESRVRTIDRHDGSWLVRVRAGSTERRLRAEQVFVCGGAIHTPFLLRRSGLVANAGRTLSLHPTLKIAALFDEEMIDGSADVGVHQVKHFAPRFSMGCSVSSRPHLHLALQNVAGGDALVENDWRRMAIYYVMVSDGTGGVRALPGMEAPLVHYRLDSSAERKLREGALQLCKLLFAAGARALYPAVIPGIRLLSMHEADAWVTNFTIPSAHLMTIHLMGTCPMGDEPSRCVVGSYGRVRGERGLYVNDASLLCTAVGVNPQGTIMALARRNVAAFLAGEAA